MPTNNIDKRRNANLYDVVAGKVGANGFLTTEQLESARYIPLSPEEVLLRSARAPEKLPDRFYAAEDKLQPGQTLPASDLLKSIHTYAADFYSLATQDQGQHDFKSLNETALLAMGILIEEAVREVLGETGDMALTESDELENVAIDSTVTEHQIRGKVVPSDTPGYGSKESESDEEESPKKRRR